MKLIRIQRCTAYLSGSLAQALHGKLCRRLSSCVYLSDRSGSEIRRIFASYPPMADRIGPMWIPHTMATR